ncbi:hypothetical protein FA09DRAFT_328341 [Tilletiopsis washingtonensis]|jgi:hypothetical protein|uniref:F-box domain-containing protein n=1 Tax=Tilletiopsis washingtonensis TaxID=58919 RepID=A0A316ZG67_9BASI|nr:hypothetical protein FA09DRAFT_328341 [Tilletiopsis washingtonensis]PWO00237.1 hypothetical protein FA09DRAFT_328341 [Tilletiopsis washingtonensis]
MPPYLAYLAPLLPLAVLLRARIAACVPAPPSGAVQQLQRLTHGLALLAGAHVLLALHLYRAVAGLGAETPDVPPRRPPHRYAHRTRSFAKMHAPPPRLRDTAQSWLAARTPQPLRALLAARHAPPPPLSACFRTLPPELSMHILRLGLGDGTLRPSDVAPLSHAHAALVRRLLLAHVALRSEAAMHLARIALLASPKLCTLPQVLFLGATHAGAAEQLLLLLPALQTLALSRRAQRALLNSPCARLRTGARPAHVLLDAVPSAALPLFAHTTRLTLFVSELTSAHTAALLALPKLALLELRLVPAGGTEEQPFRTQVALLVTALRTLLAQRPSLALDVAAPPRIAAALRRRLGIAHHAVLYAEDEDAAKTCVRSLTPADAGGLETWNERALQRVWAC